MFTEVHKVSHRDILAQVGSNHAGLHQGLASADLKAERAQAEAAERQEKADQVSQLQATILAPIQEGMQSVPDSQVRNAGSNLLRKVNLMDFKAALKKRMLEEASGSTEDSLKAAVTSLEKAKEANKKIQDQGTAFMEKFALTPTELSAWPEDLKHKLERGLFCPTASLVWHQVPDPSDMLQHYLPTMRALQNGQNPWVDNPKLLEEMPDLKHTVATAASGEASTPGADGPAVTWHGNSQRDGRGGQEAGHAALGLEGAPWGAQNVWWGLAPGA